MRPYKTSCPHCEGNNFYVTPENGMKYCFNCGYMEKHGKASYIEEKKERGPIGEIRDLYRTVVEIYHSNLDGKARQYVISRGITDEQIKKHKIGYCSNDLLWFYKTPEAKAAGLINEAGQPSLRGRIIFPYWYKGTIYDLRGRAIDPLNEVRYMSPHGTKYYRGADYPFLADNMTYPHILVEGEIKALAIENIDIRAVGIPGITIAYSGYKPRKYIICYDSELDPQKREDVINGIHRAAVWGIDPYVMTLPLKDEDKIGADDYIYKYGVDKFKSLYERAIPYDDWKQIIRKDKRRYRYGA